MKQKNILKRIPIFVGILLGLICLGQTANGQAQAIAYKVIKLYHSGDILIYSDELKNCTRRVLLAVEENRNFNFRVMKAKRNGYYLLTHATNGTYGTNGSIINLTNLENGSYILTPVTVIVNESPKPVAFINNVKTVHNAYQNGRKGMRIFVNFTVKNHQGRAVKASAFFYRQSGTALKDFNGNYEIGNKVAISKVVYPREELFGKQVVLFLPYDELHIGQSGTHWLQYSVSIYSTETNSFINAPMTTIPFQYTYTIDVMRNQFGGLALN